MNAKRNIIIASAVLALLVAAGTIFVAVPFAKGVLDDARGLARKKQELVLLQKQGDIQEEFAHIAQAKASDLQKLSALFLDPGNPISFLEFLESAASKSKFLLTIVPGSPQKLDGDAWPSIEFQISSKGSYGNFLPFLKSVENGPFLMEFKGMNITKEEGGVQFSIFLKAYTK
ncbi:MAG: hypothetical protein HYS60_02900 [Candidatus Wildermuthbacteria bacterium]|nr:hypothetical protein [Candidatus Wildermuthbacteria bacterium]